MRDRLSEQTLHAVLRVTECWDLTHAERCTLILGDSSPDHQRQLTRLLRQLEVSSVSLDARAIQRCLLVTQMGLRLQRSKRSAQEWLRSPCGQRALHAARQLDQQELTHWCQGLPEARPLAFVGLNSSALLRKLIAQGEHEQHEITGAKEPSEEA